MSRKNRISSGIQEAWGKLNARWNGEDADLFYKEYIVRITEIVDAYDDACSELIEVSAECMQELNIIEQALVDQCKFRKNGVPISHQRCAHFA